MILIIPNLLLTSYGLLGAFNSLIDVFGLSTQVLNSYNLFGLQIKRLPEKLIRISSSLKQYSQIWIDSTHDSSGFPGIGSESIHDSSEFPRYWFRSTHDSKCFPTFSIQMNSWLKQKSFDAKSTQPYQCQLPIFRLCLGATGCRMNAGSVIILLAASCIMPPWKRNMYFLIRYPKKFFVPTARPRRCINNSWTNNIYSASIHAILDPMPKHGCRKQIRPPNTLTFSD